MSLDDAGTVTSLTDDTLTLEVDRWYIGGAGDRFIVTVRRHADLSRP